MRKLIHISIQASGCFRKPSDPDAKNIWHCSSKATYIVVHLVACKYTLNLLWLKHPDYNGICLGEMMKNRFLLLVNKLWQKQRLFIQTIDRFLNNFKSIENDRQHRRISFRTKAFAGVIISTVTALSDLGFILFRYQSTRNTIPLSS